MQKGGIDIIGSYDQRIGHRWNTQDMRNPGRTDRDGQKCVELTAHEPKTVVFTAH